ncbi:MAG: DUF1349 domain-containing protein [Actinomycetota bacterium]
MTHPDHVAIAGFDRPLTWVNVPVASTSPDQSSLLITAGPTTDLFRDPGGADPSDNAPMLLGVAPPGDLVLEAVVGAELSATYDAAALMVVAADDGWAKFALELSPRGRPTIVSVVTDGWSDDANSIEIDRTTARLRLSRTGPAFACHVLVEDGWYLARYFRGPDGPCRIGFLAQSPRGGGCRRPSPRSPWWSARSQTSGTARDTGAVRDGAATESLQESAAVTSLPPSTAPAVFVADGTEQVGPMPLDDVVASVRSGQRPPTVQVWWEGCPGWLPFNSRPDLMALVGPPGGGPGGSPPPPGGPGGPAPAAVAPVPAPGEPAPGSIPAPTSEDAEELEALFSEMVHKSWTYFKRVDFATHLDEVLLGSLIASTTSTGQVLIDLTSDGTNHYVRFEDPTDRSRTTMAITHLTPNAVQGEVLGHHASVVIGWGQRVANAANVVNALKQEWKSGLVQSPEPGTVTVDGDLTSGYAYTQIDLIWALEDFVSTDYSVDSDRLTRSVRAAVHSLRKYWYGRFTPAES